MQPSRALDAVRKFAESRVAVLSAVVLLAMVLVSFLSPWLAPQNPYDLSEISIADARLPPGALAAASAAGETQRFILGTDEQGRDMLSAIMFGLRISVLVGVSSTMIALVLGGSLGLTAGYFGGKIDALIMRVADIQLSFPAILIALVLLSISGPGIGKIITALVAVQWAYYARTARSSAVVERNKEYIEAARVQCLPDSQIVFRQLLPNCTAPLIVVAALQVASAISLEATLSFLGLGLPITEPSLGLLIANGFQYLLSGKYWISLFPGIALLMLILSINLVADQLRDTLNPRLQER